MAGAVLAGFGRGWMAKPWVHDAAIGLGLATLVGCFMFFDSAAAYPSWRAALPVGSAMLIIGAGNNSRLGPAVLAARELVERPIRHRKSSSLQLRALAGGIAAIALAGIIVVRADGFAFRFPAELRAAADVRPDVTTRTGECLVDLTGRAEISDVCIESARPLIAVWGDSTAGSLMPGLRALQSQQHFGIAQLTAQSCMPVLADAPSATCLEHNRLVAQRIRDLRPDVVLLHGFGPLNAGWERTLQFLASENLRTVVLGPVPAWKRRMPDQLMNYYITHRSLLPDRSSSLVSNLWDDRFAEQVSAAHGAAYISAWQVFCEADGCLTRTPDGALTTFDTVHLSKEGSILLLRRISDRLLPAARQTDAP